MDNGDVPAPPSPRQIIHDEIDVEQAERHRLSRLPWASALYATVRQLEEQLADCKRQRTEMQAVITKQRKALQESRLRLENWALRSQAWTRERNEMLRRLGE